MRQLHNHERKFKNRYKKVIEDNCFNLSPGNIDLLKDFFDLLGPEGLTYNRRYKYLNHAPPLFNEFDKNFIQWKKEDLIKLAGIIRDKKVQESTKIDYLGCVKKLYKTVTVLDKYKHLDPLYYWLYDKRNKFYSTTLNPRKMKTKKGWFTEDDVLKIIEKARTVRDKSMFSLFATQGMRPAELFGIRRRDIEFNEDEAVIEISGKTGTRFVYVQEDYVISYLQDYLETIPEDQEYIYSISEKRANDILKEICYHCGIDKRAYLYKFRHFSVTRDRIRGLNAASLEAKFGWEKGSKRVAAYDKSVSSDYHQEIRLKAGKEDINKEPSRFEQKMAKSGTVKSEIARINAKLAEYEDFIENLRLHYDVKRKEVKDAI